MKIVRKKIDETSKQINRFKEYIYYKISVEYSPWDVTLFITDKTYMYGYLSWENVDE